MVAYKFSNSTQNNEQGPASFTFRGKNTAHLQLLLQIECCNKYNNSTILQMNWVYVAVQRGHGLPNF